MSWLRRTGSGDLPAPDLYPYVQYDHKIWDHHLIPPGTSSHRTALISAPLDTARVASPALAEEQQRLADA